jgi:two-component system sensor histidine kinase FlrB
MPQLKAVENNVTPLAIRTATYNSTIDRELALNAMVESFSAMSKQLNTSYHVMEDRVQELTHQLKQVNREVDRAERHKRQLSERFSGLLDIIPGGVVIIDNQGIVKECNPAALSFLGEPLCGERWLDIIQRNFAPRSDDGCEISLRDGRRLSLSTSSLPDGDGQIVLLTDQTETRQLQSMLSRHQRLSAMGKMMSSLAHQIRTPLSSAMLYADHLCNESLNTEQTQRFANKILTRLQNLESQVRDMLVFARGEVELCHHISLDDLVDSVVQQNSDTCHEFGFKLDVVANAPLNELGIQCNKDILCGAISNLIQNACQAMDDQDLRDDQCVVTLKVEVGSDSANLWVEDHGPGFSNAALQGIQEAFFTTKATGTGLGLSVVRSVATAHNGRFLIDRADDGAKVGMCLPLCKYEDNHDA